ncbi:MAG: hypothetical protein RR202_09785 [Bacteroidales bacterium]
MKKFLNFLLIVMSVVSFTSCLKAGLDDFPAYGDANITTVNKVEYRYISSSVSNASGQQVVKYVELSRQASIDAEKGTVTITASKPSNFPSDQLNNLSANKLVVVVGLSTAARLSPIGDAPLLGVPGDWSKPNKYLVTAADGTKKEWTISLTLNK